MATGSREQGAVRSANPVFPTTHWTTLFVPIRERGQDATEALERLCEVYRGPLVACARHWLYDNPAEAEDVVHDYIAALLRRQDLAKVRRENGRFRAFLAAGIRNQVINFINAQRARKRGGGAVTSLDELAVEPADSGTAEAALCRNWIQASIAEVLRRMKEEWAAAGKAEEFEDLKEFALAKKADIPRADLAAKYKVSLNAVDAKVSRFRRRFRELLRELIAQTVNQPDEVDQEIRFLISTLSA